MSESRTGFPRTGAAAKAWREPGGRVFLAFTLLLLSSLAGAEAGALHRVTRLNAGNPVISAEHFITAGVPGDGTNINGPSVIRVPEWIAPTNRANPAAVYYMYFGNHAGRYIRMAWASSIEGPWTLFNAGTNDDPRVPMSGALDLGTDKLISFGTGQPQVKDHIASPDVFVDNANQRVVLYFHGNSNGRSGATGTQKSFVATSADGLNFNIPTDGGQPDHGVRNVILGNAYFRVFQYGTNLFAFSNFGALWHAPNAADPWQRPANPLDNAWIEGPNPVYTNLLAIRSTDPARPQVDTPRHFAVRLLPDATTLEVLYTARGESPERIFRTTMSLAGDWLGWHSHVNHREMLRPELDWEGADLPLSISLNGPEVNVNELRDPCLFTDLDGTRYLFYTGEGEEAIGVARLDLNPAAVDLAIAQSPNGTVLLWNEYPGLRFQLRQGPTLTVSPADWAVVLDYYGSVEQRVTHPLGGTDAAAFFVLEAGD